MLRVSAVLPCYNGERWLEEALDSIHAQTRPVHEIIVVDDGSTDRSREVARSCGARVIEHETNLGNGAARNAGIRAATGDVIAWLDVDDRWRPKHVEIVAGLLERTPDAVAAFGAAQVFGSSDRVIFGYVPMTGQAEVALVEAFRDWLHTTITAIVHRSALLTVGGFDEHESCAVDFDLWLRLARNHRFVATDEITADWRWHEAQLSARPERSYAALYRYRRRFLDRLAADGDDTLRRELEKEFGEVWRCELIAALDSGDEATFRAIASAEPLVHAVDWKTRAACAVASRMPIALVSAARDRSRAIRTRIGAHLEQASRRWR
jgi:glycosyltransferase involved in cell wall biosynthesis